MKNILMQGLSRTLPLFAVLKARDAGILAPVLSLLRRYSAFYGSVQPRRYAGEPTEMGNGLSRMQDLYKGY